MKLRKLFFILIVFFKTETLFSKNELFNVNNIQLEKNSKITNNALAEQGIKKGFNKLITRVLLKEDKDKLSDLNFSTVKQLVTYYQIMNVSDEPKNEKLVNFNVTFDKEKIHNLFYSRGILYSDISDKELFVLPILIKKSEFFIFNNNFFHENWNEIFKDELIEFVLPLENIEIIKSINDNKNSLIDLNILNLFQEYKNKNLALVIIEDNETSNTKVYIKTIIQEKNISKSFDFKKKNLNTNKFNEKIITEVKKELINLVKSQNLIDIRTPSFLNTKLDLTKRGNLVELNSRIKNIDSIEKIFVQEFNKDYIDLRIKYLGKLDKLINQLKKEKIDLKLINDQWVIKTL
jgi:hypothetical protein